MDLRPLQRPQLVAPASSRYHNEDAPESNTPSDAALTPENPLIAPAYSTFAPVATSTNSPLAFESTEGWRDAEDAIKRRRQSPGNPFLPDSEGDEDVFDRRVIDIRENRQGSPKGQTEQPSFSQLFNVDPSRDSKPQSDTTQLISSSVDQRHISYSTFASELESSRGDSRPVASTGVSPVQTSPASLQISDPIATQPPQSAFQTSPQIPPSPLDTPKLSERLQLLENKQKFSAKTSEGREKFESFFEKAKEQSSEGREKLELFVGRFSEKAKEHSGGGKEKLELFVGRFSEKAKEQTSGGREKLGLIAGKLSEKAKEQSKVGAKATQIYFKDRSVGRLIDRLVGRLRGGW